MRRNNDLDIFYEIMKGLKNRVGGYRNLSSSSGRMDWPARGVYFFSELGETRNNSNELRCVRVGTHALRMGSKTKLWNRLRQHGGTRSGKYANGGNHRGSIFRLHVGNALRTRHNFPESIAPEWGIGSSASSSIRNDEQALEELVSSYMGKMPFLWLAVDDQPGPESKRVYIERNSIALLSSANQRPTFDHPSRSWLGFDSSNKSIRESGLWNVNHVFESYEYNFLEALRNFVDKM